MEIVNQDQTNQFAPVGLPPAAPRVAPDLISLDYTAVKLDVCKKTVSRLVEDGELGPKVKVRGCAKLFVKHVEAYLDRIRVAAERKYQMV